MTQINRTPFCKVADIPAHLLTSDKLKWQSDTSLRRLVFSRTADSYTYLRDDETTGVVWYTQHTKARFRPYGLSWEAAEALVNPPQPKPQPAKTEEPFRPGLPPAELRAVCEEWEWGCHNGCRASDFVGDYHRFLDTHANGRRRTPQEMAEHAQLLPVCQLDHFRPLGKTWAEVEALAAAKLYRTVGEVLKAGLFDVCSHWYVKGHSEERRMGVVQKRIISSATFSAADLIRPSRVTWEALEAELAAKKSVAASVAAPARKLTPNETSTCKHPVPVGGWVMRTDEGYPGVPTGTRGQVEGVNGSGSYRVRVPSGALHAWAPEYCEPCEPPEPTQEPTYIVACPKGRRKYVKYYLSQHIYTGNKDLDALPYSTADKPFYMGYVSAKLREELTALAPDIRFSMG